jgi:hypothetical protein
VTHEQIVIPEPDSFGFRVTAHTPLAHLVAVLRRANPRATFGDLKTAASALQREGFPAPATESEVSREASPGRFDSGADSAAHVVRAVAESEVGETPDAGEAPAATDSRPELATPAPGERKPTRAEVEAWLARQPKRNRPVMSKSGRIPAAVLTAYRAAHRDEVLASMVPVEGGSPMPAEPPDDIR